MLKTIEISEHCFGHNIKVNGEDINVVSSKLEVVNWLIDNWNSEELDEYFWKILVEMVAETMEFNEQKSSEGDNCEQCGAYCFTNFWDANED